MNLFGTQKTKAPSTTPSELRKISLRDFIELVITTEELLLEGGSSAPFVFSTTLTLCAHYDFSFLLLDDIRKVFDSSGLTSFAMIQQHLDDTFTRNPVIADAYNRSLPIPSEELN